MNSATATKKKSLSLSFSFFPEPLIYGENGRPLSR
jgi:hypothetical protein